MNKGPRKGTKTNVVLFRSMMKKCKSQPLGKKKFLIAQLKLLIFGKKMNNTRG